MTARTAVLESTCLTEKTMLEDNQCRTRPGQSASFIQKRLTLNGCLVNNLYKCLKSRVTSGTSPRQQVAFFAPIVSSMGKGEAVRNGGLLGWLRDFNTLTPPHSLEIVCGGFQSQPGAHHG